MITDLLSLGLVFVIGPVLGLRLNDMLNDDIIAQIWFGSTSVFFSIIGIYHLLFSFSLSFSLSSFPFLSLSISNYEEIRLFITASFFMLLSFWILFYVRDDSFILWEDKKLFGIELILFCFIFIFSYVIPFILATLTPNQGVIYGNFSEGTNILNLIITSLLEDPLFILIAILTSIGGLGKTLSSNRAAQLTCNVLIIWLPSFIWTLVLLQVIKPPEKIVMVFNGNFFFAWIMYVLIIGSILVLLAGIQQVFQGIKNKLGNEGG